MRSHVGLQMRTFKVDLAASWVADVTSYPRWVNHEEWLYAEEGENPGQGQWERVWCHFGLTTGGFGFWATGWAQQTWQPLGTWVPLEPQQVGRQLAADWAACWDDCRHSGVVCREGNHLADDRHRGHSRCGHCGWRPKTDFCGDAGAGWEFGRCESLRKAWESHKVQRGSVSLRHLPLCLSRLDLFGDTAAQGIFFLQPQGSGGFFPKWIVLIVEDAGCFHGARSVVTQLGISCMTNHTGCLSLGEFGGRYRVLLLFERYSSNVRLGRIWQWFEVSSRWRWCHPDLTLEKVQSQRDCKVESNTTEKRNTVNSVKNGPGHDINCKGISIFTFIFETTILTNALSCGMKIRCTRKQILFLWCIRHWSDGSVFNVFLKIRLPTATHWYKCFYSFKVFSLQFCSRNTHSLLIFHRSFPFFPPINTKDSCYKHTVCHPWHSE